MRAKDAVGEYGERIAARHLEDQGMRVLARRWRCPLGEIDLVVLDGDCLVVCEVKTRRSTAAGDGFEAVTPVKLARLGRLASAWLAADDRSFRQIRIDVVAVVLPRRGAATVEHLRGVS